MTSAVAPRSNTLRAPLSTSIWPPMRRRFLELLAADARETVLVYISGLDGTGVQVVQPFMVRIDPDDEGFIAKSPISLVYEMGETWQEALRNYVPVLVGHFEWLVSEEASLSPSIQSELALLREHLQLEK